MVININVFFPILYRINKTHHVPFAYSICYFLDFCMRPLSRKIKWEPKTLWPEIALTLGLQTSRILKKIYSLLGSTFFMTLSKGYHFHSHVKNQFWPFFVPNQNRVQVRNLYEKLSKIRYWKKRICLLKKRSDLDSDHM